jgi:hypothetical protein
MISPRTLVPAVAAAIAALALAAPAKADLVTSLGGILATDPTCTDPASSTPFALWNDTAAYVPAPGGSFENGLTGWTTIGAVNLTSDNEPWKVTGNATDATSVTLGPGATIASGGFCGGADHPTLRLFTRAKIGSLATGAVTVRYTGQDGLLYALPLGVIVAGSSWQPSAVTLTLSGLPLLTGTRLGVSITALTGSLAVDDLYVDPIRRS